MNYAILGLRRLLRSIKNQCVTCRKRKASTIQPIMSDLPVEGLGYKQPPFNHTGVDYFGPPYVPVFAEALKKMGISFYLPQELLACIKSWNGIASTIFAHKGVTWKFNPPGAPHYGGSWERLV